jgi:hypothetical protein
MWPALGLYHATDQVKFSSVQLMQWGGVGWSGVEWSEASSLVSECVKELLQFSPCELLLL